MTPFLGADNRKPLVLIAFLLVLFSANKTCAKDTVPIGDFSSLDPAKGISDSWEPLTFPSIDRHTEYSIVQLDDRTAMQAKSKAAASGLIRRLNVDPAIYPILTWQWRVEGILDEGDVTTKQGDDCAARIYVAFEFVPQGKSVWERFRYKAACIAAGRQLPGSALTYVWGNKAIPGTITNSPYTKQSVMVVVESGSALLSQWVTEKRDIVRDYQTAFGREPPKIMGVAIMTDTDNTGASTIAYYGDIRLERK